MSFQVDLKLHELVTRDGREIFRIMKISRDGISGELECIYSRSSIYEVGEVETNMLCRYDRITPARYPYLFSAIRDNFLHLQLSPEALTEVIRQAYEIGIRDGINSGKQKPLDVLNRCSYIYRDIDMQLSNGPLNLHKYDLEQAPKTVNNPYLLHEMISFNCLRNDKLDNPSYELVKIIPGLAETVVAVFNSREEAIDAYNDHIKPDIAGSIDLQVKLEIRELKNETPR